MGMRVTLGLVTCLGVSAGILLLSQGQLSKSSMAGTTYDFLADFHNMNVETKEDIEAASDLYFKLFNEPYTTNIGVIDGFHKKEGADFVGEVDDNRLPYSDYWFPEKWGGTNGPFKDGEDGKPMATYALTLYDQAFFKGESTAAKWEAEFHNQTEPSWFGHCNGFSAAASRHANPGGPGFKSVKRPVGCEAQGNCVEFDPRAIRALMAEVYMNAIARFVGGHRCEVEKEKLGTEPENRGEPTTKTECEDPDPGVFHLAMVNWLGKQKQVMVADVNADVEVWNYPVYRYTYNYESEGGKFSRDEIMQVVGSTRYDEYVYNPNAKSFVVVNMDLYYAKALERTIAEGENEMAMDPKRRRLRYILELDDNDNIIGGEWLGWTETKTVDGQERQVRVPGSKITHPDFVWIPFETFTPSGNRTGGNPHIDAKEVLSMWAEARGLDPEDYANDPNNPVKILRAPVDSSGWGDKPPWYKLSLDGGRSGGVFLGKDVKLAIEPTEELKGSYDVEIIVNGEKQHDLKFERDNPKTYPALSLSVSPGINRLQLKWMQGGEVNTNLVYNLRFYAMP